MELLPLRVEAHEPHLQQLETALLRLQEAGLLAAGAFQNRLQPEDLGVIELEGVWVRDAAGVLSGGEPEASSWLSSMGVMS